MGSQEVMEHALGMDTLTDLCNGGGTEHSCNVGESENVGELLNDFDSYWEDISDRLTVSRMVNDSVIKGMVCAIEQEAADKVAQKELELAKFKETLDPCHICLTCQGQSVRKHDHSFESSNALHETKCASFENLKMMAAEQFKKLKKEIDKIKGQVPLRKRSSDPELLGLSGILEDESKRWTNVDGTLVDLKSMVESICQEAEVAVLLSKSSLFLWQQEKQFQTEIEGTVIKNCVWGAQDGFENELQAHNSKCLERIKEISSLREDLESISKSLSSTENGYLLSHGSLEHRKVSSNHVASTTSPLEENGKHEPSIVTMPENLDLAQLKHFSRDELGNYFKGEMMKMKRYFEQIVQEKTEEIFSLKRDYMKERGSSLTVRKDKEFDILKRRIPDVIQKLDDILVESEKWPAFSQNTLSFKHMSDKLNSLLSENRHLRELLADKKREVMCLSSQVSDASDKSSKHFMAESKLLRTVRSLKQEKHDVCTESLVSGDLFKFLVEEAISQLQCYNQDLLLKHETAKKSLFCWESFDSDSESIIAQGLCEVVFRGAMRDAEEELGKWLAGYQNENEEHRLSLEREVFEKEKILKLIDAEKEDMEQEIFTLVGTINERDRLVQEATNALNEERVKLETASIELRKLRAQTSEQGMKLLKSEENLHIAESKLVEALKENEVCKDESCQLSERLDCAMKELLEAAQEKIGLLAEIKENSRTLSLYEQRERECREQLNSMTLVIGKLSGQISDFEIRAEETIRRNCSRVENLGCHLISLGAEANNLRKMGSAYKHKLEKMGSDLQKAEAEVDLLGDEVDTLLSLLEKIYIALDHYSPILRHYPGIIEILKLVRRELSGDAVKQVQHAR